VRGTLLSVRADGAAAAQGRAEAATARAGLRRALATLAAAPGAPGTTDRPARALRDGAGPRAAAVAAATETLLAAVTRAGTPGADRGDVDAALAAERDLLAVTNERSRILFALTDRELAEVRRTGVVVTASLLLTLATGLLLVVRPAARALERLVAELLASRAQLEAATAEATRGREFAASLVASAADAIYAFDAVLRITEWNPAMERWTGVARADALGRAPAEFEAELDWGEGGRPYARALRGETTALTEVPGRAGPGEPLRYFDVICAPLYDARGAVAGGVVTARDVTERVAALARLRASEARFSALYRQAPLGIAMHDDDGVIVDANPAFERLLGRPLAELRGQRAADLSPPEDASVTRTPVAELRAGRRERVEVEKRFVRGGGDLMWASLTVCRVDALGDGATTVGMVHDITERKALEARLSHQAYHDPLTGLANRARLRERVEAALARDATGPNVAVLYVDLDDFKRVNDSLGHAAGDRLLAEVAGRLLHATRGCDTVARLGGDEFAVLLERVRGGEDARVVAARVGAALRAPFAVENTEVVVGASVGIARVADLAAPDAGPGGAPGGAPAPDPAAAADLLLRGADVAMYAAKRAGKGRFAVYDRGMNADAFARLELEADLRRAVAPGDGAHAAGEELRVHYQPIVELATGRPVGAEALVRWQHPRRGLIAPGAFVPLAEETGLVVPLGWHVLAAACAEAAGWPARGGAGPTLTVNVSARQLVEPGFVDAVSEVLARSGLAPARLLLELTESVLAQHDGPTLATLRGLKRLGVRLGIDDFGTGYSSLRYLQQFPVDVLKVDRGFVAGLRAPADGDEPAAGVALARAVVALGRALSLHTVAEGVETEAQRAQLLALGCEYGQGFLFARPMPAEQVRALFRGAALVAG
jgi:diguanylate cyclase (GGDEF)-like protein/PAS domain S-box-containing protein